MPNIDSFVPTRNFILVRRLPPDTHLAGGHLVTTDAQQKASAKNEGTILAVGPTYSGTLTPGLRVVWSPFDGTAPFPEEHPDILVLNPEAILLTHSAVDAATPPLPFASNPMPTTQETVTNEPTPCDTCDGSGILNGEQIITENRSGSSIERCDTCKKYASDVEAAAALASHHIAQNYTITDTNGTITLSW